MDGMESSPTPLIAERRVTLESPRGVTPRPVRKAIDTGRIDAPNENGWIDFAKADEDWASRTMPKAAPLVEPKLRADDSDPESRGLAEFHMTSRFHNSHV